jgi:hypothetical protein
MLLVYESVSRKSAIFIMCLLFEKWPCKTYSPSNLGFSTAVRLAKGTFNVLEHSIRNFFKNNLTIVMLTSFICFPFLCYGMIIQFGLWMLKKVRPCSLVRHITEDLEHSNKFLHKIMIVCSISYMLLFFNATTCPSWTSWSPSRLWPKCNRLLRLGHPLGAVTLSRWGGWWYMNMEYQEGYLLYIM